jgi:hypothetical protein
MASVNRSSHTARNVRIITVVVVVLVVAFLLLTQGVMQQGYKWVEVTCIPHCPFRPSTVLVTGNVNTVGIGTHPVGISFTSVNGQVFSAAVVNGVYSVNLPNDHTYSVQIEWSSLLGASGTCNAGSLTLNVGPGNSSLTNNWSC